LSQQYASQFLVRKRRANSFMEESKKGNLERECVEELCNKEEAREIFENNPETEYFYPKYLSCLASHRAGIFKVTAVTPDSPADLRACVSEISNQCSPLPCHKDGYKECIDGQAKYTCVCKPGWQGERCEEDINECEDFNGGCSQRCSNLPGSYRCLCEDGYFMHSNKLDCGDINECVLHPNICGTAICKNTLGKYKCECAEGYTYNSTSKNCEDIDECAENVCAQLCVNSPGSYSCYCDGKKGFKLSKDMKNCESVTECIPLDLEKNYELLYLAEQFIGIPVLYLKFKLPNVTSTTTTLALPRLPLNSVPWHHICLFRCLQGWWLKHLLKQPGSPSPTPAPEQDNPKVHTMTLTALSKCFLNIVRVGAITASLGSLFQCSTTLWVKNPLLMSNLNLPLRIFLPFPQVLSAVILLQINPRLDGCIRAWNLMNQGHSGVKEVIQEKQSKHCLVSVGRGSFYPGTGMAKFQINYNNLDSAEDWLINVTMTIRPSTDTGVMFALVSNETVPLALSIVDSNSSDSQKIIVTIGNITVAQLESKKLCTSRKVLVGLLVTKQQLELSVDSHTDRSNSEQLSVLHQAMMTSVVTYLGGLPDVPLGATLVTAFYNGCMEVKVNSRPLDLDEAISKHNDIRSHSCPLIMQ
ncbi:PROS protein, partial [Hemiprocne comata]|nr:PROS protein [Hemiprocne comata]